MKINISINEVKTTNQKQYSFKVKTHRNRNRKKLLKKWYRTYTKDLQYTLCIMVKKWTSLLSLGIRQVCPLLWSMLTSITFIQNNAGRWVSHKARKGNKRHRNQKGRNKIIAICRCHYVYIKKFQRIYKNFWSMWYQQDYTGYKMNTKAQRYFYILTVIMWTLK